MDKIKSGISLTQLEKAGEHCIVVGINAQAIGFYSAAVGKYAYANGRYAFAYGPYAVATGDYSIAIGPKAMAKDGEIVIARAPGIDKDLIDKIEKTIDREEIIGLMLSNMIEIYRAHVKFADNLVQNS